MTEHKKNQPKGSSGNTPSTNSSRVIGEGMTSLDSTQAPLIAETGLPDYAAMKGKGKPSGTTSDGKNADRKRT